VKLNRYKVLAMFAIACGLIYGILRPSFLAEAALADLVAALHHFAATFDSQSLGMTAIFESLLRYGRPLLLIWACAVLPKGFYAAFLVLYLRALTLGFSAAMMVSAFGGRGFTYALALYALQNLIIMPIYIYTICVIAEKTVPPVKAGVVGLAGVVGVSMIEVYVSPLLFELMRR